MKTIIKQMIGLVIALLIVGACIFFLPNGVLSAPLCIGFVMILGAFLGLDLARMIQTTSLKPPGDYQPLEMWQYIVGASMCALLFAECVYRQSVTPGLDLSGAMTTLAFGVLIIIGLIVGGIQGNKLVTGDAPKP
jgi:hypothetical protein